MIDSLFKNVIGWIMIYSLWMSIFFKDRFVNFSVNFSVNVCSCWMIYFIEKHEARYITFHVRLRFQELATCFEVNVRRHEKHLIVIINTLTCVKLADFSRALGKCESNVSLWPPSYFFSKYMCRFLVIFICIFIHLLLFVFSFFFTICIIFIIFITFLIYFFCHYDSIMQKQQKEIVIKILIHLLMSNSCFFAIIIVSFVENKWKRLPTLI